MVEAYRVEKEPKRAKKEFIYLVVVLILLASSAWGLALNSQWRLVLYASLKEAALPTPVRTREVYQPPKELTITYFDVGQGLAHLIQIPSGKVIMYDAGEGTDPDWKYTPSRGAGKRAILPVLRGENIKRIDYIVGSHPHSDHLGGFLPILSGDEFEVGALLDPGMAHPTPTYKAILEMIEARGISYRIIREGDILDWGPDVFVQVISPPRGRLWDKANDNSITIMLVHGRNRFLFTGDIEERAIDRLVRDYGLRLKADVVQIPHHGSNSSNDRNFIRLVGAAHAVTSGTGGEPFGHPTPETVKRWKEIGAQMHHTHLSGNITFMSDGKNIRVKTVR
ncbi:MAG: ComE operon protein 3 [Syntrophomonadaceae bacterium]|nr:ComE operon protein 3 [Bacillota bacterium]MBT9146971.1 ComE operon protein 3 [Bacillota bacterium]